MKRKDRLPQPDRHQPPPPGAEVVEISSDDDKPAFAPSTSSARVPILVQHPWASGSGTLVTHLGRGSPQGTIDLTMDDDDDEGVPTTSVSAPAVSFRSDWC